MELSHILTSLMTKVVGATNINLLIIENLSNRLIIVQYLHTTNKDLKNFHQCKPMCHLSLGHLNLLSTKTLTSI